MYAEAWGESICLQKPNNVVGGTRKKTERESEKTISVFSNIKSLFVSVYPLLINLFVPSFLEGNSIITEERQFLIIPAELWLTVIHCVNEHGD